MFFSRTSVKTQIIILIIILIVVIFLISIPKLGIFQISAPLRLMPSFEGNDIVSGNTYYNNIYRFGITRPTKKWRIALGRDIQEPPKFGFQTKMLEKARWISAMYRFSGDQKWGEVLVAAFHSDSAKSASLWAKAFLAEVTSSVSPRDSLVITQDVIARGKGIFQSAFFMVELPEQESIKFPVMVPLFRARKDYAIALICRARFDTYELVKDDFEKILTSFEWFSD